MEYWNKKDKIISILTFIFFMIGISDFIFNKEESKNIILMSICFGISTILFLYLLIKYFNNQYRNYYIIENPNDNIINNNNNNV